MVAMQWQGGVLSLFGPGAYPQEEKWLTCNTWEGDGPGPGDPRRPGGKVAAIAAAYAYAQAAIAAQDKLRDRRLPGRPGPGQGAASGPAAPGPGTWPPPWPSWRRPQRPTPKTPTNSPPFWPLRSPLTASRWWPTGTSAATAPT